MPVLAGECPADKRVADGQGQKMVTHAARGLEYASNCAVPIVHRAGDVAPEKNGTSHWWQNHGKEPSRLISVDLFPVADRMGEKMM